MYHSGGTTLSSSSSFCSHSVCCAPEAWACPLFADDIPILRSFDDEPVLVNGTVGEGAVLMVAMVGVGVCTEITPPFVFTPNCFLSAWVPSLSQACLPTRLWCLRHTATKQSNFPSCFDPLDSDSGTLEQKNNHTHTAPA